jgi:hypothetical protein
VEEHRSGPRFKDSPTGLPRNEEERTACWLDGEKVFSSEMAEKGAKRMNEQSNRESNEK